MAFAYTVSGTGNVGNKKIKYGTYSNVSLGTGGAITTGLYAVNAFMPTSGTATAVTSSISGGVVTITCANTDSGTWAAIGV